MAERVTIQDIADALGVSRNTVSKAINNTGVLAEATREKILQKAIEMGYKQFSYINMENIQSKATALRLSEGGEIALLTGNVLGSSHFSATMIDNFQCEISKLGYSLSIHRITNENFDQLTLPITFMKEKTSGILCFEVFHADYAQMLCDLDIPILFVDSPPRTEIQLPADMLYMDNSSCIYTFIAEMKKRGKTKIGFIGNKNHCQSFFERYMAFRTSLMIYDMEYDETFCIAGNVSGIKYPTHKEYRDYISERLSSLSQMPDVFICSNDFVAIDVIKSLRKLNISVPDDVYLCGFDDSPESKIVMPSLTTIHIHSQIMGYSAVQLLISRINEPSLNYRIVHTETNIKYRESTDNQTYILIDKRRML